MKTFIMHKTKMCTCYKKKNRKLILIQISLYYVGDIVNILAVVRYKSMYEIESIGV